MASHEQEGMMQRSIAPGLVSPRIVAAEPNGSRQPPVFLHSSFRTCSTWLYQKLRSAPTTLAYYEIFNESLMTLTTEEAKRRDFSSWYSKHPPSTSYFLEFLPLLKSEGGVANFDENLPFGNFIPLGGPDGDLLPSERRYVDWLITNAQSKRRIPVLSGTRSLGRARALRRAVGGQSILLHRNLFHQWASYCEQAATENKYFLFTIQATIKGATHDPFMKSLSCWFDFNHEHVQTEDLFAVFIILHLYLYSIAFDVSDLVVDISEIANDRHARQKVEYALSEMIHHEVDLSDVRDNCEFSSLAVDCSKRVRDTIEQWAKLIPLHSVSSAGVQFIEQAKDRALAEWDRFEFYNRRTRTVLNARIKDAETRLRDSAVEIDALKAERDRFATQTSQAAEANQSSHDALVLALTTERDTLKNALPAIASERDAFVQRLSQAEVEQQKRDADLTAMSSARDAALDRVNETCGERDVLQKQLAELTASREELEHALAEAKRAADASIYHRARTFLIGR